MSMTDMYPMPAASNEIPTSGMYNLPQSPYPTYSTSQANHPNHDQQQHKQQFTQQQQQNLYYNYTDRRPSVANSLSDEGYSSGASIMNFEMSSPNEHENDVLGMEGMGMTSPASANSLSDMSLAFDSAMTLNQHPQQHQQHPYTTTYRRSSGYSLDSSVSNELPSRSSNIPASLPSAPVVRSNGANNGVIMLENDGSAPSSRRASLHPIIVPKHRRSMPHLGKHPSSPNISSRSPYPRRASLAVTPEHSPSPMTFFQPQASNMPSPLSNYHGSNFDPFSTNLAQPPHVHQQQQQLRSPLARRFSVPFVPEAMSPYGVVNPSYFPTSAASQGSHTFAYPPQSPSFHTPITPNNSHSFSQFRLPTYQNPTPPSTPASAHPTTLAASHGKLPNIITDTSAIPPSSLMTPASISASNTTTKFHFHSPPPTSVATPICTSPPKTYVFVNEDPSLSPLEIPAFIDPTSGDATIDSALFSSFDLDNLQTTDLPHALGFDARFKCVCGKLFDKLAALKAHARLHKAERNHVCEVCDRAFVRKQDLKRHKATHNSDFKPFECTNCSTTFTRSDALHRHLKAKRCM